MALFSFCSRSKSAGAAASSEARPVAGPPASNRGSGASGRGGNPAPPWFSAVVLFGLGVVLTWYSVRYDYLLGQIGVPLLSIGAIQGLWRGGLRKILMLLVTIGLLWLLYSPPIFLQRLFDQIAGSSAGGIAVLLVLASVALVWLVSLLLVGKLRHRWIGNRPRRLRFDRLLGGTIGSAEAAFIVLAICWTAVMIRPHAKIVSESRDVATDSFQHRAAIAIVRIAGEASIRPVDGIVRATNLIERSPTLREAIHQLNSTGKIDFNRLDPQATARLNEMARKVSNGHYQSLDEILRVAEKNQTSQKEGHRPLIIPKSAG